MSSTHSALDIFRYYLSLLLGFPCSIFLLSAQVILDFRMLVLSSCHTLTTNRKVHSLWLILTHTHIHTGMNTHSHIPHNVLTHEDKHTHTHTPHTSTHVHAHNMHTHIHICACALCPHMKASVCTCDACTHTITCTHTL